MRLVRMLKRLLGAFRSFLAARGFEAVEESNVPGYQPRIFTDHVWYNGTDVFTYAKATGLGVRITEIRGWDERPDLRDVRELRSGQDGEYANNAYLGGRTISVSGVVHGSSWEDLQARKRALAAVFQPGGDEVLFKVPEPDAASPTGSYSTTGMTDYERVSCRVVEPIMFGDLIGSAAMTFQVVLRASDPRVYSDTATSTDSGTTGTSARTVTVDQGGTYETPPTLTVTGPTGSEWTVTEPSSGLSIEMSGLTLTSSDSVEFDTLDRTATLYGPYEAVRTFRSDLVALWMLDETSGTTADNAEGTAALDGTYSGDYTLNQSGPVSGVASVDFGGVTSKVTTSFNAALALTTFTFETWLNPDSTSGTQKAIAYHKQSGAGGWWMTRTSAENLLVRFYDSSNNNVFSVSTTGGPIDIGSWYHIALVLPGPTSLPRLYVNGELAGTGVWNTAGTYAAPTSQGFGISDIGALAADEFDGKIGPTAFYSTALSGDTIGSYYEDASSSAAVGSAYPYLLAQTSRWAQLGTASSTYTLASSGLNTGSKLNVTYRDARL